MAKLPSPEGIASEALELATEPERTKPSKQAQRIAQAYEDMNRGGAPVSPQFVQAALDQGLQVQEIRAILRSQALGGPKTSATYSSRELLDYFTEHPGEIRSLYDAAVSTRGLPQTYQEYLVQGGAPGGYRSPNQVLQEAVLGIGAARDAYLSGAGREGVGLVEVPGFGLYDPASPTYQALARQGKAPIYDVTPEDREDYTAYVNNLRSRLENQDTSAIAKNALMGLDDTSLVGLSDVAQKMLGARRARHAAQGDFFSATDLMGDEY